MLPFARPGLPGLSGLPGLILGAVLALSCGGAARRAAPDLQELASADAERPAILRASRERPVEAPGMERVARLRLYIDHDVRGGGGVAAASAEFAEMLDVVNQLLVPELGVRLEVTGVEEWTRQAPAGELGEVLAELEARDSGAGVEWIVGLVGGEAGGQMDELVRARALGQHIVVRFLWDDAAGKELAADVRAARKVHRQAAALLHGLGHTLGALHVVRPETALMFAGYGKNMSGFVEKNADSMRVVMGARLMPEAERVPGAEAVALAGHLGEAAGWPGWVEADYAALRARLAELVAEAASAPQAGQGRRGVPPEAKMIFARVQGLTREGKVDAALGELDNLLQAYPMHMEFRMLACRLWLQKEGPGDTAAGHCRRVGELDGDDARGALALAGAHAQKGQLVQAHEVLRELASAMGAQDGILTEARKSSWDKLLGMYQGMQAVTWAEEAAAQAPEGVDTEKIRSWALSTRRRYGLPPGATKHKIGPEREGEYLALVRGVLDLVYAKKYDEARRAARKGLATFPDAPGFFGALCDLEYRSRRVGVAHGYCSRAVKEYGEASWPRYLLGIVELKSKRNRAGIGHLEKAVAMDPDLRQAYHALYQAYGRVRDRPAQEKLRKEYYERFGVPILQN